MDLRGYHCFEGSIKWVLIPGKVEIAEMASNT